MHQPVLRAQPHSLLVFPQEGADAAAPFPSQTGELIMVPLQG